MDFKQAQASFKQLKAQFEAGQLEEPDFKAQLEELMVQDEQGAWWMIGYETERWYRYDGTNWVRADPPGLPVQASAPGKQGDVKIAEKAGDQKDRLEKEERTAETLAAQKAEREQRDREKVDDVAWLQYKGMMVQKEGKYDEAERLYRESLAIADELKDEQGKANILRQLEVLTQERLEGEKREREKAERETTEKAARGKAKQDAAKRAARERSEREAAEREAFDEIASKTNEETAREEIKLEATEKATSEQSYQQSPTQAASVVQPPEPKKRDGVVYGAVIVVGVVLLIAVGTWIFNNLGGPVPTQAPYEPAVFEPIAPYEGAYEAASGVGDSLTDRTLTLSTPVGGTLTFWTWYDIEQGYDRGLVEVSTDGGTTWTPLQGSITTTDAAITGNSGGWIEATFTLPTDSGVLVRFNYLTDGSTNGHGWFIDDVRINGFSDNFEDGSGANWDLGGWMVTGVSGELGSEEPVLQEPTMEGPKVLRLNFGPEEGFTLDPALVQTAASIQVVDETFVGLTRINEVNSTTEPGMATAWDIVDNDDGTQTITFYLRDDVPWVRWNGSEVETVKTCDGSSDRLVTAHDFAYGIQRTLDPDTSSTYAYLWTFVLKGATEFNYGDTDDFSTVGVNVIDDYTLQLTFFKPAAYNAQIAGMWVGHPQPQWIIEGDDCTEPSADGWTEPGLYQTFGPYTVSEWIPESSLTLVKNPFWPGSDGVPVATIDEIHFSMLDETAALAEYEAGNLDVASVPQAEMDRVKADSVLSQELVFVPIQCSYYYGFNTQAAYVNDVRVRRALSMAIDRQSLIDNVLKGGQEPAQWFSRPGSAAVPTLETYPDLGIKYDPESARGELQSYLDENGLTADQLDLTLMYNTSTFHENIAKAIQQIWADVLGVNVQLASQDFSEYFETIRSANTPQIWRQGWCSDYPDANNFIGEVFNSGGSRNPTDGAGNPSGGVMWWNDNFEEIVRVAAVETSLDTRVGLYADAEDILVNQDAVIIPIYWYTRNTLTKPYVQRTFGVSSREAFEKWDVLPH